MSVTAASTLPARKPPQSERRKTARAKKPTTVAEQWTLVKETEAEAHLQWEKLRKEVRKLVKLANMGRKHKMVVPISDSRGIKIVNQYRTRDDKIFTPAFCKRFDVKEVPLDSTE
ncbi:MAG TPA: hypothetical protein VMQ17_08860 [Candidatus Sulfotelmatobacter sp.]|nr:hypothetical protein [Candidatus Sulfotelmatobacter sp.]